jgi:hypothetical protein
MPELDQDWDGLMANGTVRSVSENAAGGEATNALMAQVMADAVGEEPEIEPAPDTYVPLPGGLYWNGELLRDARVRELTGEDEEALDRIQGSVARWVTGLLERAVVSIGGQAPTSAMLRKALVGDRDALLLGVRIATFGRDLTMRRVRCPHCQEELDATIDLSTIEDGELSEVMPRHEYSVPLRKGGSAVVRLPDGAAQEAIFKKPDATLAERNTALLGCVLVRVVDTHGQEQAGGPALAKSLSMADRQSIIRFLAETQPGPRLDAVTFEHACGREVRLPIELGELFRID